MVLCLIATQWWFLLHLLRQNGRLLGRLEALESSLEVGGAVPSQNGAAEAPPHAAGLPVGSQAPDLSLKSLHGETLTLDSLRAAGKQVMLLFTDPNCGPCNALLPEVGRWQEEHSEKLTVALISRGEVEENRTKAQEHALQNILLQEDWEVSERYQVSGTPSAVLVGPDGKVNSSVASGPDAIRGLVAPLLRPQAPIPVTKKVGEVAPEVKLPDLEGNTIKLEDFRGEETLILFWNPGVWLLPADAPRPKRVGREPTRGHTQAPCGLRRAGGGQQGDGPRLCGGARPAVRRRAGLRGKRHALWSASGRQGKGCFGGGCGCPGGSRTS